MKVFSQFCHCVERASIDEAYLDLTNEIETKLKTQDPDILSLADKLRNTYVIGWENNQTENNVSSKEIYFIFVLSITFYNEEFSFSFTFFASKADWLLFTKLHFVT